MSEKTDIRDLAREVDRIMDVSKLTNESQVNATVEYRKPFQRHPVGEQSKDQKVNTRSDRTWTLLPGMCKYHSRFGELAKEYPSYQLSI